MASITVLGPRRTVAELDAAIGRVERARREQLATAARAAAAGRDPAPLRAILRLTEDYLACLRQSRAVLLWELSPEEPSLGTAAGGTGATGNRPRRAE